MNDHRDPHYTPFVKVTPPKPRRPAEPLWELRTNHVTWSAELRFHGESYGWEAMILRDGELAISRRFILKTSASAWADGSTRGH